MEILISSNALQKEYYYLKSSLYNFFKDTGLCY